MHTQIGKWGNSLAIRIPGPYAKDLNLKEGMELEVSLVAADVKGLSGAVTIAKDQSAAKLAIQSDAATPAGNYVVKLQAKLKVNNQPITVEQMLTVNVAGKPASK